MGRIGKPIRFLLMSQEITITADALVYPRADGKPCTLEIQAITNALNKIPEVEFVTVDTAPPLLALFNFAVSEANKHLAYVRFELDRAENAIEQRKAIVLLDESARIIESKGQKPTDKLREAAVMMDEKYQELSERAAMLKAIVKLIEGHLKSLDMAYMSVKKIYSEKNARYFPDLTGNE